MWIIAKETDGTHIMLNGDRISIIKEDGESCVLWLDNGMRVKIPSKFYDIRDGIIRGMEK